MSTSGATHSAASLQSPLRMYSFVAGGFSEVLPCCGSGPSSTLRQAAANCWDHRGREVWTSPSGATWQRQQLQRHSHTWHKISIASTPLLRRLYTCASMHQPHNHPLASSAVMSCLPTVVVTFCVKEDNKCNLSEPRMQTRPRVAVHRPPPAVFEGMLRTQPCTWCNSRHSVLHCTALCWLQ